MKKVVYNGCYGGFGLSKDAVFLLLQAQFPLESFPLEGSGYSEGDFSLQGPDGVRAHADYTVLLKEGVCYSDHGLQYGPEADRLRSHPLLVQVVEHLGARANGHCSKLCVQELPDEALYRISEYDGYESVEVLSQNNYVQGYCMDSNALVAPAEAAALTLFVKDE
jgi:hypothetical protein